MINESVFRSGEVLNGIVIFAKSQASKASRNRPLLLESSPASTSKHIRLMAAPPSGNGTMTRHALSDHKSQAQVNPVVLPPYRR